jgi:hypothetical protein
MVPEYGAERNGFPDGCFPFFDQGDGFYLHLKPLSDRPNAVWDDSGTTMISPDLVTFFQELYKDPNFYRP